ncbi:MAG: energy transducer TonB [Pseudomonadota bacterium]
MSPSAHPTGLPARTQRNLAVAAGVALVHLGAIWALQNGLVRRPPEQLVPVEVISEVISPAPAPSVVQTPRVVQTPPAPPPPVPKRPSLVPPAPAPKQPLAAAPQALPAAAALPPAPQPMATPTPAPAPAPRAPVGATTPQSAAAPVGAPVAAAPTAVPTAVAPAAPAPVQLPSSDADYLQNPKPAYPAVSKRLGEQGKVVVRVLIATDGTAQRAEIRQSSGFDRLDQAALNTALKWRYVPGTRGGVPEAMWFNVPINFVLE